MAEYQAIYKCRLCGEMFTDSLISEKEAEECMEKLESGKPRYRSVSSRNDITIVKPHLCCNGNNGIADFLGFRKVE